MVDGCRWLRRRVGGCGGWRWLMVLIDGARLMEERGQGG
jgi:hypothetical protein